MRFLKRAKFDLDESAERTLASEIENFLRVGSFTLAEWESLSEREREIAVGVKRALRLEDALLLRGALQASTLEQGAALLRFSGDEASASHILLREAVGKMSSVMGRDEFAGVTRE